MGRARAEAPDGARRNELGAIVAEETVEVKTVEEGDVERDAERVIAARAAGHRRQSFVGTSNKGVLERLLQWSLVGAAPVDGPGGERARGRPEGEE